MLQSTSEITGIIGVQTLDIRFWSTTFDRARDGIIIGISGRLKAVSMWAPKALVRQNPAGQRFWWEEMMTACNDRIEENPESLM